MVLAVTQDNFGSLLETPAREAIGEIVDTCLDCWTEFGAFSVDGRNVAEFALHVRPDHLDIVEFGVARGEKNQVTAGGMEDVLDMWALGTLDIGLLHHHSSAGCEIHALSEETALRQQGPQAL